MKKIFYSLSALFIATLLSVSFYFMLFNLFAYNSIMGLSLLTIVILISITLVSDKDFIQEVEE